MIRVFRVIQFNLVCKPQRYQVFSYCQPRGSSASLQDSNVDIKENSIEDYYLRKKRTLDEAFQNVDDIPSLIKVATSDQNINYVLKAIDLLAEWNKTKTINFEEVESDKNYKKFLSVIERKAVHMPVEQTIKALKNLHEIGIPSNSFLIESLEVDLLWNVKKVSLSSLLSIIVFQHKNVQTERQKQIVEEAVSAVEAQWTDVDKHRDFCIIYSLPNIFSADFIKNVDDLLTDKAEDLSVSAIADIILAIGNSKRRPIPLLKCLSYQIFKQSTPLPPSKIKNVFYAMNALNFHDDALLGKLSSDFLDQIKYVTNSSIIGTIAYCVGHTHWKDKTFLNALATWVIDNINVCKHSDVLSLIISLATVNHIPDNIEELIRISIPKINFSLISKNNLVDLVWSLTLLGQVTDEQMAMVLEPSFVSNFKIDDPLCVGSYLKILNINSASELIYTSYNGPKLQLNSNDIEKLSITRSKNDLALHDRALKLLHNFLPPPKYIRENIKSTFGCIVDAELIVDKQCRPLDLTDYPSSLVGNRETKALPVGAHKVAVMILSYKDYNKGLVSLTGPNVFAIKLLNNKGYKVVEIPYSEVSKHEKSLRTVQNFERKIRESIQN